MFFRWRPYVSMAERRRKAEREMAKLKKKGRPVSSVAIDGRAIAKTFWGKAWCDNLERYSDFSNRLPRGRTYVRNGAVLDLQIAPGEVKALVSGSSIYKVAVKVSAVPKARWRALSKDCAGDIHSLVELLQGRFSKGVMERICRQETGLFPAPAQIEFSCSCPDWASMCKHVAAALYGIGARLDAQPELLFKLRKVDEKDLIAKAGSGLPLSRKGPAADKVLAAGSLSELFGLDIADAEPGPSAKSARPAKRRRAQPPSEKIEEAAARRTSRGQRSPAAAKNTSKPPAKPPPRKRTAGAPARIKKAK